MIYVVFCQFLLVTGNVPGIMLYLPVQLPYLILPELLAERNHLYFAEGQHG